MGTVYTTGLAGRIIAIDLGARRIGVAMTDGLGLTAQPLETIPRRGGQRDLDAIAALVRAHGAERIVLGLPLDPDGERGRAAKGAEAFAERLRGAVGVPIEPATKASAPSRRRRCCWRRTCPARGVEKSSIRWRLRLFFGAGWTPGRRTPERRTNDGQMTKPMKRALIAFLITSALGLIALVVVARTAWRYGDRPGGTATGKVTIDIPNGASAFDVAGRLKDAGLIGNPTVFRLYAGQRGVAGRFKAGRYDIVAPASPKQILDTLVKGAADELVTVVVPPGKNLLEVAEILAAAGIAGRDELAAKASDPAFAAELGLPGNTLEGYLFPDTYRLRPRSTPARALIPLVRRHRQVWSELRAAHAKAARS